VTAAACGTIDRDGGYIVFRFECTLRQAPERVWAALTEPALIGLCATDHVLRAEPPTLFEHTFRQQMNPDATVTWRLSGEVGGDGEAGGEGDGGCAAVGSRLTLTHRLSDSDLDNTAATGAAVTTGDDRGVIIARDAEAWYRVLDELAASLRN
jgi:hypothetical protein